MASSRTRRHDMTILDAIRNRRSLRRYLPQPVPVEVIKDILTAAIWAPSAHNRQPWRFTVIQSSAQKELLARNMGTKLRADLEKDSVPEHVIEKDVQRSYSRLTSAPVLILLSLSMQDMDTYPDEKRNHHEQVMAIQSTAMAGQNILLAAHSLGLGACWMCAPLFVPHLVRETLDLPEDWQPQGLIAMGYPAQVREKTREPLETRILWR